jgi:hypothetical protein
MIRRFIFFTHDGYTYDPKQKEIHNIQILGNEKGSDVYEAFSTFKKNNSYLQEYAFTEVTAIEVIGDFTKNLYL